MPVGPWPQARAFKPASAVPPSTGAWEGDISAHFASLGLPDPLQGVRAGLGGRRVKERPGAGDAPRQRGHLGRLAPAPSGRLLGICSRGNLPFVALAPRGAKALRWAVEA